MNNYSYREKYLFLSIISIVLQQWIYKRYRQNMKENDYSSIT